MAGILETFHLRPIDIFIFNFFFFIFTFIFVINYSSSSWRGSPRRGELAIPFPIAPILLPLRRRARHHRESSFFPSSSNCSLSIERRSFPSHSRWLEGALVRRHVLRSVAKQSPKGLEGILVPRRGRKLFVVDLLGLRLCRRRTLQGARADRFWRAVEMSRKRKNVLKWGR